MEKIGNWDWKTVISVLTQGREFANELKNQLNPTTTSVEGCDILMQSVHSSIENALKLLDCVSELENDSQIAIANTFESHNSMKGSPRSEGSHQNNSKHKSKKRKTEARWSEQVRVSSGAGCDGQLGDGYHWRKYGQKDILGANHPRAYYRCTHRNTQGCLATKQVQRADEDPSIFEVIYKGKHSCMLERSKQRTENLVERKKDEKEKRQEIMISIEPGLKPENQEMETKEEFFPSFSFTPIIESDNVEARLFSEPNFIGTSYSSPFISPAASESYFSLTQCPVSDFSEIMSNPTPVMNFPFEDLEFSIDHVSFDSDYLDYLYDPSNVSDSPESKMW